MVFWLCPQVLEDRLFPIPLHIVPILDLTMADGIVHAVARCLRVCKRFIADEEVEVLDAALGRKMTRFGGKSGPAGGLRRRTSSCYRGGEDTGGGES